MLAQGLWCHLLCEWAEEGGSGGAFKLGPHLSHPQKEPQPTPLLGSRSPQTKYVLSRVLNIEFEGWGLLLSKYPAHFRNSNAHARHLLSFLKKPWSVLVSTAEHPDTATPEPLLLFPVSVLPFLFIHQPLWPSFAFSLLIFPLSSSASPVLSSQRYYRTTKLIF